MSDPLTRDDLLSMQVSSRPHTHEESVSAVNTALHYLDRLDERDAECNELDDLVEEAEPTEEAFQ